MDRRGYQQYKQQSVNSMTPGELLLLLYDELVKRGTIASIALDKADYPTFEAAIDRCVDIINSVLVQGHQKDRLGRGTAPLNKLLVQPVQIPSPCA